MHPKDFLDQLTDDQLINVTKHHAQKFDRAWMVCMSSHYRSGRYIDAHDTMEREYDVLGQLHEYVYSNRPAAVHDRFTEAAVWSA
jgi:hypothetical protein